MRIDGTSDELRVPSALRDRVSTILAITDPFCTEQLDAEYASLCRRLVAKLARKRPSPLERGDLRIWAAGAIYALGVNNFLFEPSQTPHLSAARLSELLEMRKTTMAGKAKRIATCSASRPGWMSSSAGSSWSKTIRSPGSSK